MRGRLLINSVVLAALAFAWAQGDEIVVFRDGKPVATLRVTVIDSYAYVSTDQLLRLGEGGRYFAPKKFKESIRLWGRRVVFSPESPFVVVDGTPYNLGLPTLLHREGLLVPLRGFVRAFAQAVGATLSWRGDTVFFASGGQKQPSAEREAKKAEAKRGVVVIDPGHGGKDPGAVGPSGVREKDVVLSIAKYLRDELEELGFDAVLTRYGDVFLPLSERTQIANRAGADIFVSVHCNAGRSASAHGTQVFYLSPSRTDEARAAAALENRALLLEDQPIVDNLDELKYIMVDMVQSAQQRESSILAYIIEQNLSDLTGLEARGPEGAEFYVLYGAFMPAVLVETAFISNADEEKFLAQPQNQRKIARAIAKGIEQFWENIKR